MFHSSSFRSFERDGQALSIHRDDGLFWRFYLVSPALRLRRHDGRPALELVCRRVPSRDGGGALEVRGRLVFELDLAVDSAWRRDIEAALRPEVQAQWERLREPADDPHDELVRRSALPGGSAPAECPAVELVVPPSVSASVRLGSTPDDEGVAALRMIIEASSRGQDTLGFEVDLDPSACQLVREALADPALTETIKLGLERRVPSEMPGRVGTVSLLTKGTTLGALLGGGDHAALIREIDADFGVSVSIHALAAWELGIAAVEVETSVPDGDVPRTATWSLTPEQPSQWMPLAPEADLSAIAHRHRIVTEHGGPGPWTEWRHGLDAPRIDIVPPEPPHLWIVAGVAAFLKAVEAMTLELELVGGDGEAPAAVAAGDDARSEARRDRARWTATLTESHRVHLWLPRTDDSRGRSLRYRVRDHLRDLPEAPWSEWIAIDEPGSVLTIEDDRVRMLELELVPMVDWDEVAQLAVSVRRHESVEGDRIVFDGGTEARRWRALRSADAPDTAQVQVRTMFRDGEAVVSGWTTHEGGSVVILRPAPAPSREVEIDARHVDFTEITTARVELEVELGDGERASTFVLVKAVDERPTVRLCTAPDGSLRYRFRVVYDLRGGVVRETPWLERTNDRLVSLPGPWPQLLQVRLVAAVVDFAATPKVEVALDYEDAAHDRHVTRTFTLTSDEDQLWSIGIETNAPREYTVGITWTRADGTVVAAEPETRAAETLVVPRPPGD